MIWAVVQFLSAAGDLPAAGMERLRILLWPWVPVFVLGLLLVLAGLTPLLGCFEIGVEEERVWRRERLGPIWLSYSKRPRNVVRKVMLVNLTQVFTGTNLSPEAAAALASNPNALALECEGTSLLWLVRGYPRDWVRALAEDLSRRCGVPVAEGPPNTSKMLSITDKMVRGAVQLSEKINEPRRGGERPADALVEQPRGSRILFEQRPDGVTLTVPAEVLRNTKENPKGCLLAGAIGCGSFALVSTVGLVAGLLVVPFLKQNPAALALKQNPAALVSPVFSGVLLWLAAWAFYHWYRKAQPPSTILATSEDRLFVHRTRAFSVQKFEWTRDELKAIRVELDAPGSSNPDLELQIVPRDGEQVRLLNGVKEEELNWVAAVLRHTLGISE